MRGRLCRQPSRAVLRTFQKPSVRATNTRAARGGFQGGLVVESRHAPARPVRAQARFPDEVIEAPRPLNVHFTKEGETTVRLIVNVPAARCEEAYKKVLQELRKDYNVPGFRNNEKVPVDMLVQAAGGERQVKFACLEQVMHSTITEAFEQCPEEVIDGTVKVESNAEELVDLFRRDADLQYVVSAETGDLGVTFSAPYIGMELEVQEVLNQEKENQGVEQALTRFLRDRGGSLQVAQRGAKPGDTLIIDFEVRNRETQEPIPGMAQDRFELDCLSDENFLPGVIAKMEGMRVGEQNVFEFAFPDPWDPQELAGVEASVRVKVQEVLEWTLPELTLDMCKSVDAGVTSIDGFMAELRSAVRMQAEEDQQARVQSAILEHLTRITMLKRIPETPFETFALGRYEGRLHEALESGVIKHEQLEEMTQEQHVRGYIDNQRETLEKEFAVLLAVDEIFKREGLTVNEADVEKQVESQREEFKKAGKIASLDQVKEYIRSELQQRETIEFLKKNCTIKIVPISEGNPVISTTATPINEE